MNSTTWTTLTEFVKHLGKMGLCIVDETPKGWFIQYIDRDPEVLVRVPHRLTREGRNAPCRCAGAQEGA